MNAKKASFWDRPFLDSRTDRKKVGLAEMAFGYFLGPLLVQAMTCVVATYYLTFYRSYEDIVEQGGFLFWLPLVSVIPMALSNIIVGILLGRTRTRQGKARPYIFAAAPLLLITGIVMFVIPYWSLGVRMAWMAITYNLFAAVASPVYSNSHSLMVSLSTRDLNARGKLSVVANVPAVAANGLVANIVMPLVLGWIRNSPTSLGGVEVGHMVIQNRWQVIMTAFSVAAFLGCMLEYFFTRERITEEDLGGDGVPEAELIPTGRQLKAAVSDRFWWIIMIFYILYQAGVMFKGGYVFDIYCKNYFSEAVIFGQTLPTETIQSVLALLGGVPLAVGMLFAWPVANKIGKRNFVILGCVVSIVGSLVCLTGPGNFTVMVIGQILKGFSSIPGAYIMMALFADVLDHLEAKNGFRVDGISMSVYSTILTVVNGLAVAFFNLFYDGGVFTHEAVSRFFFLGFEVFAHGVLIVVLLFLTVEKNIKEEQALIAARKAKTN